MVECRFLLGPFIWERREIKVWMKLGRSWDVRDRWSVPDTSRQILMWVQYMLWVFGHATKQNGKKWHKRRRRRWTEWQNRKKWRHQGHRQISKYFTLIVFSYDFFSSPLMSTSHKLSLHQTLDFAPFFSFLISSQVGWLPLQTETIQWYTFLWLISASFFQPTQK